MLKVPIHLPALFAVVLAHAASASAPSPVHEALRQLYSEPIREMEAAGTEFKVYQEGDVKIVAACPPSGFPLFLSYTKSGGAFSEEEVRAFLSSFEASASSKWLPVRKRNVSDALRFFQSAPKLAPQEFSKKVEESKDPTATRKAWLHMASDSTVAAETEGVARMLEAQSRIWLSSDGRFLAVWSGDKSSLGVGTMPRAESGGK